MHRDYAFPCALRVGTIFANAGSAPTQQRRIAEILWAMDEVASLTAFGLRDGDTTRNGLQL
jgi:hypothetical protein